MSVSLFTVNSYSDKRKYGLFQICNDELLALIAASFFGNLGTNCLLEV